MGESISGGGVPSFSWAMPATVSSTYPEDNSWLGSSAWLPSGPWGFSSQSPKRLLHSPSVDARIHCLGNPKKALPIYMSRLQNEASHNCIIGVGRRTIHI